MVGQNSDNQRLVFIDAFRGIAIIMVVLYHAYARWIELYPFKNTFADNPFLNLDQTGVYLFFVISGFVINISLSKSADFSGFMWRRWLRLFPAMFLASLIVLGFSQILPNRPEGMVGFKDALPGLSFISPQIWHFFGLSVKSLEGAFWSLYIEVIFYLIYGASFFLLGAKRSVVLLSTLAAISIIFAFAPINSFTIAAFRISEIIGIKYYFLFVAGILLAQWRKTNDFKTLLFICFAIAMSLFHLKTKIPLVLALSAFIACLRYDTVARFFSNPLFLYFGAISYPLYLVHEGIMIAFMQDLARVISLPPILMPLLPIGLVLIIAAFVTKHETSMRETIRKLILTTKNSAMKHLQKATELR